MKDSRRLDLMWLGDEVVVHDELRERARAERQLIPEYVKRILRQITLGK
jgi:hypothetical protein